MLVIAFAQLADGGRASEGSSWAGRWSRKLLLAVCPGCIPLRGAIKGNILGVGIIPNLQKLGVWSGLVLRAADRPLGPPEGDEVQELAS